MPKHEFRVTIDVDLPQETVKRITSAVQRAVLTELAGTELGGPMAVDFLNRNGGTQGIAIKAGGSSK